jgi:hypothetical protein
MLLHVNITTAPQDTEVLASLEQSLKEICNSPSTYIVRLHGDGDMKAPKQPYIGVVIRDAAALAPVLTSLK